MVDDNNRLVLPHISNNTYLTTQQPVEVSGGHGVRRSSISLKPKSSNNGSNRFKALCVKSVNSYHSKHINTPPLEWDDNLAARALAYANVLKRKSQKDGCVVLEHDTKNNRRLKMGENLWYQDSWRSATCADADRDWYSEIKDWSFQAARSIGGPTGHFTQMVWRSTTRFGVGVATFKSMKHKGNKVTIIVAKYQRPGNFHFMGQRFEYYAKNVQPLKSWLGESDGESDDAIESKLDVRVRLDTL